MKEVCLGDYLTLACMKRSKKWTSSVRVADISIAAPNTELIRRPPTNLVPALHAYLSCWLILSSYRVPNANCLLSTPCRVSTIGVRCAWCSVPVHLGKQVSRTDRLCTTEKMLAFPTRPDRRQSFNRITVQYRRSTPCLPQQRSHQSSCGLELPRTGS